MTDDTKPKTGRALPKIFDDHPDLRNRLEAYLNSIPEEQKRLELEKFEKFVAGELTWSEVKGIPRATLKILAEIAYQEFVKGYYPKAETLFKGLSIIDHSNWYYRAALGAIYQKQKLYAEAIEEYSMALTINESEITCLTNRGECYLLLNQYTKANEDFTTAISLDKDNKNNWAKRARAYQKRLIDEGLIHG